MGEPGRRPDREGRLIKISADNTFTKKISASYGGIGNETIFVRGRFDGNKVTGRIRSRYIGGGERCDTQERKFSAKRR